MGEVLALPLLQGIEVDRPPLPAECGGRREECRCCEREIHDDPVEGGEADPGKMRGIRERRDDVSCPVEGDVLDEEVDCGGV